MAIKNMQLERFFLHFVSLCGLLSHLNFFDTPLPKMHYSQNESYLNHGIWLLFDIADIDAIVAVVNGLNIS
ncbi:hypothetical protein BD408DRAFT_421941 [Parasitella parasitica]|nr:hypothetical protein BD408DRAFT_421941 [Parasitella parasitica]